MDVNERSVQEIGKSLLVSLPKAWTKVLHIRKGTKLKLLVSERGALTIMPELVHQQSARETTITFDEHFNRRFFREYFEGYEKIIILFERLSEKQRAELSSFLQRFMNIQVIEETGKRIVVKCFRIDELSMEECLQRMHYLSLNMLEQPKEMHELRNTMTRFYYMLVMQVRRFLSEGKYTENNQVSLIKAMDIRMVAEKIQRIGEIAMELKSVDPAVLEYYKRCYACFANNDFEKALPLWAKGNNLRTKGEQMRIVRYAKEISMLVR